MAEPSPTNKERWRALVGADHPPGWNERTRLLAKIIKPGAVVCDLGAGQEYLRTCLPSGCVYVPVDCVRGSDKTFVVDFNVEFRLPDFGVDVFVGSGFFEYLRDLPLFLGSLRERCPRADIIGSYAWGGDLAHREASGWLAPGFGAEHQALAFFESHLGAPIENLGSWQGQLLFKSRGHL